MNEFKDKLPIELFYWPTSNGFKISIFLEEAGYPYNVNFVNISKGKISKSLFYRTSNSKIYLHSFSCVIFL